MSDVQIAAIVEGHGECEAVPVLIRRIAFEIEPGFVPQVLRPIRVPSGKLVKPHELERSTEFAARKLGGTGGILIVLDCDVLGCCPARKGPELLARATAARGDMLISVVLAKPEFEAWFLAAAESLRGERGLPEQMVAPNDPEGVVHAKEWLSGRILHGYSETADQPALTALFDLQAARRADSFDKCYRDVEGMLRTLRNRVHA